VLAKQVLYPLATSPGPQIIFETGSQYVPQAECPTRLVPLEICIQIGLCSEPICGTVLPVFTFIEQ
jgi:hypothetical protein